MKEIESGNGEETDVISLIMKDEVYSKNIEFAIDDVIIMFVAGSKTVQGTTTNFLGQYMNNEELRKNFHAEIDPLMKEVEDLSLIHI